MITYINIIRNKINEIYEEECLNGGCLTKEEFIRFTLILNDMENYVLMNFEEEYKPLKVDDEE